MQILLAVWTWWNLIEDMKSSDVFLNAGQCQCKIENFEIRKVKAKGADLGKSESSFSFSELIFRSSATISTDGFRRLVVLI